MNKNRLKTDMEPNISDYINALESKCEVLDELVLYQKHVIEVLETHNSELENIIKEFAMENKETKVE